MFKNILIIAVRCLWKQRLFSFINLTGLTLGLSACIFIYLYVSYELSYDAYHTKAKNIYRFSVYDDRPASNGYNSASPAIGPTLLKESPSIQAMARVDFSSFLVSNSTNKFQEDNVMIADSSLFSIFTFPLLNGDATQALTQPFSTVLSQTAARKYFGTQNPIGRTLKMDWNQYGTFDVKVTGVMQDIPENSHFRSDLILSFTTLTKKLDPQLENCWNCPRGSTYLLVDKRTNEQQLQSDVSSFLDQHADHLLADQKGHLQLAIEPLQDIYLHAKYPAQQTGNISNVYMFSVIAVFILLIAGVNFINLSTACASQRAKEIAIRKVVGSSRAQLIWQFLSESLLLSLAALGLALLICSLLLPSFNELCNKIISNNIFEQPQTIVFAVCTTGFIGIAAGLYPAFLLSSFKPSLALKGDTSGQKKIGIRELLGWSIYGVHYTHHRNHRSVYSNKLHQP
jgi:putative ABC transport system permease protein